MTTEELAPDSNRIPNKLAEPDAGSEVGLLESERQFRRLADSMPQLVWVSDSDGRVGFVNEQWFLYTGQPKGRVDREEWLAAIYPDDRAHVLASHQKAIHDQTDFQVEYRIRRYDGEHRWHLARTVFVRDSEGLPIRRFGTATDIHARKVAEEALRKSQAQLNVILQGVSSGVIAYDQEENFVFANGPAAEMLGFQSTADLLRANRADLIGRFDFLDEQEKAFPSSSLPSSRVLRGEHDTAEAVVGFRSRTTGSVKWLLYSAKPILDSQNRFQYVVSILNDFSDRKKIELERERLHDQVKFLDEASQILSSSLDYRATLTAIVELAVPKLGDGCSIWVIEDADSGPAVVAHSDPGMQRLAEGGRTEVLRTGKPQLAEEPMARSLMHVPIQGSGKPLGVLTLAAFQPGRYSAAALRVAEELGRRAGLAIENARHFEQAQAAVRMRDEFLSIASHELKTPLTALKLQAQLNAKRLERGDPAMLEKDTIAKFLEATAKQVDRLGMLVDDMLDISRITHGKLTLHLESVDLGQLVREIVDSFDLQLKAQRCEPKLRLADSVVGRWDRYRIEQVVINLITNAMKYAAGAPIEISVAVKDERAILEVRDQGPGIPQDSLERIFHRFERAVSSDNISGLGLGLYISHQIVEAHRGAIRAGSVLGEGSVFTVELPRFPAT